MSSSDPFGARAPLGPGLPDFYALSALESSTAAKPALDLAALPVTVKILLENLLRNAGRGVVPESDVAVLAAWRPGAAATTEAEIPFLPARVILQDFTGVPAVVDLAAMRDAMADLHGDPARVNPLVPADLVIDHSVQVDRYGTADSFAFNVESGIRAQRRALQAAALGPDRVRRLACRAARHGHRPPGEPGIPGLGGGPAARSRTARGEVAFPDTLVGTDSHTTMINGLGVLGYGVGGIEAEAVLLGQPLYQPMPRVVGVRLSGQLPQGATATDLVLVVTQMLRAYGVVGAFVEFTGDGLAGLTLADRATISNMSPEFGATATLFPIDDETLAYLRLTGRAADQVELIERYARKQGLWRLPGVTPEYDSLLTLDLGSVEPSLAGPRRPQDRVALRDLRTNFRSAFPPAAATGRETEAGAAVAGTVANPAPSGRPGWLRGSGGTGRRGVLSDRSGGGRRSFGRNRLRFGRHRGHNELHQYVKPDGHGRGRTARPQRRGARPHRAADRQDQPGARIARRDGVPPGSGAPGPARDARLRAGRLRLYDLHRQ